MFTILILQHNYKINITNNWNQLEQIDWKENNEMQNSLNKKNSKIQFKCHQSILPRIHDSWIHASPNIGISK